MKQYLYLQLMKTNIFFNIIVQENGIMKREALKGLCLQISGRNSD